ncbi:IS66 family transposase [Acetobacter vaccinii]|uniref:IS66 family transposase n=2 Tax=Acetobacteraceae TaxID=433 RepID=A0A5C1YRB0_9PROT|nr:IS66 family transposase [Acetobacter vaccinii]QEO18894.1 IS66 family transposase [Acetobacter vaccinii]
METGILEIDRLRAALAASEVARQEAERRATGAEAMVAHLKLLIAKMRQDRFGASSERGRRLLEQLELELEDLETAIAEDDPANAPGTLTRASETGVERQRPARRAFPAALPRERIVIPAPFHPIARGRAGPWLLSTILTGKFADHLPLNRQSAAFAREGIDLDTSTLADWVGACTATLAPLIAQVRAHVLAAERLHGDDTTVPVLAKSRTVTGRLWTYVRDDRPFGGPAPPAAWFRYSRDRKGEHPTDHLDGWSGILQSDAYGGYNRLFDADRKPAPVTSAGCWAHARRGLFKLAELGRAPLAVEAVRRIDAIFEAERTINGATLAQRLAVRQERVAPMVNDLLAWMRENCARLSKKAPVAAGMAYILRRPETFTRFLHDGRICLTNNAAERALRGIALGRKAWLFAGSDRGGQRSADMYSLIVTAKLNDVDPQAWLADVLARINDQPVSRLHELLPWNWKNTRHANHTQVA